MELTSIQRIERPGSHCGTKFFQSATASDAKSRTPPLESPPQMFGQGAKTHGSGLLLRSPDLVGLQPSSMKNWKRKP
jgi:hypothetical protein